MSMRKIVTVDDRLCNGCAKCVTGCSEGALKIVDGKARLVNERFCDGFGDCIGACPTGALKIEERESPDFDMGATTEHVRAAGGEDAVRRMVDANKAHAQGRHPHRDTGAHAGCPGTRMRASLKMDAAPRPTSGGGLPAKVNEPELDQWPVQIHLVSPGAPFFANMELAVISTCSPLASADVHWRFMRGRGVVVGCPKLDDTTSYVDKLAAILSDPTIPKVLVVRMEVPCCGGLTAIVRQAVAQTGRSDLEMEEVTVGLDGGVI